jgi:NADH-quinone oxidoreductase subunit N
MMFEAAGYQLLPVLPEIVLVIGAMASLMIGAWGGQRAAALGDALRHPRIVGIDANRGGRAKNQQGDQNAAPQ